jgi:hypothetical protein
MEEARPHDGRMPRRRVDAILGALTLVAVGLFFIWRSLTDLPLGTLDNPGPAAMPLLLAVLLVIFALWSIAAGGTGLLAPNEQDEDTDAEPGGLQHAILIVAATIAAALAFGPLGYRLTILGLLLFFLGIVERKPIITVLLLSFALSFGSHALFVHVLKIPLPSGPMGL